MLKVPIDIQRTRRSFAYLVAAPILLLGAACDGPTEPRVPAYAPAEITHFEKLATAPPSTSSGLPMVQPPNVRKWAGRVRVAAAGSPTPDDLAVLTAAIEEIRAASGHHIEEESSGSATANLVVHFVSRSEAERLEPDLQPFHVGYYRATLVDFAIVFATVIVVSDEITAPTREYIVRHELMHAMGFPNHLADDPTSVMHQPWAGARRYSPLDGVALGMMYRADIKPGMEMDRAVRVLARATIPAGR